MWHMEMVSIKVLTTEKVGKTWGLKTLNIFQKSSYIPTNSDIVWVAAQGPLWSKGGERGLFKTVNGGITWKQVLGNKEWTGVTDIMLDPRDSNVLYAATWDRHRTVAALMGGGPGTAIYRSDDGGRQLEEIRKRFAKI